MKTDYCAVLECNDKLIQCLTFSRTTSFRLFQLKESADDNFKFDESGRMFSKWVENTVGKGEIARYEQFLLIPHFFQKTGQNQCLFGKGLTHEQYPSNTVFDTSG